MSDPDPTLIARAFDLVPVLTGRSRQETARIISRFAQDALDAQAARYADLIAAASLVVAAYERDALRQAPHDSKWGSLAVLQSALAALEEP